MYYLGTTCMIFPDHGQCVAATQVGRCHPFPTLFDSNFRFVKFAAIADTIADLTVPYSDHSV